MTFILHSALARTPRTVEDRAMGDSVAVLWESELLRARQWIAARRKDKQQEREQLFQRVKRHIGFQDHQRSLQSAEAASEDENDRALDFLGDVDASDMTALLQAEAHAAAGAVPPVASHLPSARGLMTPLEMPVGLVSPTVTLKRALMSQMDPKRAAGATLGNEAGVQELMQELALDVTQLQQSAIDDGTTKESTPPHILKNFGGERTTPSNGTEQSMYMRQVSSKSPPAPHIKMADTTAQQDDVADEMVSWVSGYRDPEIIQRKENMRRQRKQALRYGVASAEEGRQVLKQVAKITHDSKDDSDRESDDNISSDYSPEEDEETSEQDENEGVDFLSDDYLDNDEGVKQKRKRLRQVNDHPQDKKSRSQIPTATRKLTQQSFTGQYTDNVQEVQVVASSAESKARHAQAAVKSTIIEAGPTSTTSRPIELMSSEDETEANGKDSISNVVEHKSTSSHGAVGISSNAAGPERTMELSVLQDCLQKESLVSKVQQHRGIKIELTKAAPLLTGSEIASEDAACGMISTGSIAFGPNETAGSPTVNEKADTSNVVLLDAETIYLEDKELPRHNEEHIHGEVTAATTKVAVGSGTAAEKEVAAVNAKRVDKLSGGKLEWSVESGDEDVSEAETEILEDDESNTDYLGLDYSENSYSDSSKQVDQTFNSMGVQRAASSNKKGGTESETKATNERHSSADVKQEVPKNQKEDKAPALTTGVQQFFDFAPLKLKSKVKTVTSTAPKPLPVHSYNLTHSEVGKSNFVNSSTKSKKTQVVPTTPSIGSNGLRPSKKLIATSTTTKGKYLVTRRCTKMLDDIPSTKRQPKRQYAMAVTKKSKSNVSNDLDDVPLTILAKELSGNCEDTPQARYLSYAGANKTEEPPRDVAETPRIVSKSRFGGGGGLNLGSSTVQNFPATSNGQHSQLSDKDVSAGGYRREPQISIYDALHMDRQESAGDVCKGTGYKRSSRFKKMQEEAARNGTPMVKTHLQDKDWDKVPIPKKKNQAHQVDEETALQPSSASDLWTRSSAGRSRNKPCKKDLTSSIKNSGSSYYGPKAGKHDSSSRVRRGRERSNCRRDDDRKKKRSPSPLSRDRGRNDRKHRLRGDRGRRGSSRSMSRSVSPRRRDYSNSRNRCRSRSRSWSRERSSEHNYQRTRRMGPNGHDRDRYRENNSKRSHSPEHRDSAKKKRLSEPPKLDKVCQNGKIGDIDRSVKKQKISHSTVAPPSPGVSEGDDVFIADSDEDENALIEEVEDIRFDLDSVPVDETLMMKQVYVTGLNPTVCAEQIEEDFARFGVGVDRETGFPAIEVFTCQRNYLGRGDARVTFKTEEGAQEAVKELDSKNVKNSMIHVRRIDVHTQRILTLQFQAVRDMWKCTKTLCRADVSVWNAKCDKCGRKRVYGPSNIKIGAESWLCSLCFTANDSFATSCYGCMESLPEIDRSAFYTS